MAIQVFLRSLSLSFAFGVTLLDLRLDDLWIFFLGVSTVNLKETQV